MHSNIGKRIPAIALIAGVSEGIAYLLKNPRVDGRSTRGFYHVLGLQQGLELFHDALLGLVVAKLAGEEE
ncbi:MAG: hypothetical protein ACI4AL_07625, partial [Aristaeellaceae bacterium]